MICPTKHPFHLLGSSLMLLGLTSSLSPAQSNPESLQKKIHIALSIELESLDPQTTRSLDAIKVQSLLFETLVAMDPFDGSIKPAGAASWDITDDGLQYTFQLRPNARWSNGEPLTSEHFRYSLSRLLSPDTPAPFADQYLAIRGSRTGQPDAAHSPIEGLDCPNPSTLIITLDYPVPYMLYLLARPCAAALHPETISSIASPRAHPSSWSLNPRFPSSGPYLLERWSVNASILLIPNPFHPASDLTHLPLIEFHPIESAHIQERAFLAGQIDVTSKIPSERIQHYLHDPALERQIEMGTFYLIPNHRIAPLSSPGFRHRISQAIDRETITNRIRMRGEQPTTSFLPPFPGIIIPPLPPSATEPLSDSRPLILIFSSSETNQVIAEAIQAQLVENTALQIHLQRMEWKAYLERRSRGEFDLCLGTWTADYPDPMAFLEMWTSSAPNNFAGWRWPPYDAILRQSASLQNTSTRLALLSEANAILQKEMTIIPLFHLNRVFLINPSLKPWGQSLINTLTPPQKPTHLPLSDPG